MDYQQEYSEDEFILDDQPTNSKDGDAELCLPEMPSSFRRKSKKSIKLKKKKSSKKKKSPKKKSSSSKVKVSKSKKKHRHSSKKKREKSPSIKRMSKIPVKLDQKIRSMALLEFEDDAKVETNKPPVEKEPPTNNQQSSSLSTSVIDEILCNQSKIFVPSNLLRFNRDGTMEETEQFKRYMEKKNNKNAVKVPKQKDDSSNSAPIDADTHRKNSDNEILLTNSQPKQEQPMTTTNSNFPTDIDNNNTINIEQKPTTMVAPKWQSIPEAVGDGLVPFPLLNPNTFTTPPPVSAPAQINIPPQMAPPSQQSFLLPPPNPSLGILGAIPNMNMFKGSPNPLLNSPIRMNLFNTMAPPNPQSIPSNNLPMLGPPHQPQQPPLFQLPPPQNNFLLDLNKMVQFNTAAPPQEQQQQITPSKIPLPVPKPPPPPIPNGGATSSLLIPPPPPPPYQSTSRCGLDSPMDIEEEEQPAGRIKPAPKKKRSRSVQIADELMKKALKPYFLRKKITKEEYKDIMKRGVAKLSKRESLRPEKVEKFVQKYVHSIRKERDHRNFH